MNVSTDAHSRENARAPIHLADCNCRQLTPCTSSFPPRVLDKQCLGLREQTFFLKGDCNLRFWNEYIHLKTKNIYISPDLLGVHCFLNTSCHCLPLWCSEEQKGLQGHGLTLDLIAATIPY